MGAVDETFTLTLPRPIEFAGQKFAEFKVREPTVGDLLALRHLDRIDSTVELVARCAGQLPEVIERLPASAGRKLGDWLGACCVKPAAPKDSPEGVTIRLRKPLTHEEGTLFEMVLREPTLADLKHGQKYAGMEEIIVLVAALTNTPRKIIEQLPMREYRQAEAYLNDFL